MPSLRTLQLHARDPIHLPVIVQSHGWFQLLPLEWNEDAATLRRTEQLGSAVVELEFRQLDDSCLEMSVHAARALTREELTALESRARWMLVLDQDLREFYELCGHEPRLAHVPAEGRGRVLRSTSVFEDAVKCICTTNTTWTQTKGMVRRLVERLGAPGVLPGTQAFPTLQAVVAAGENVLQDEVRLGYRSGYVFQLAQRIADRDLDLEALKSSDLPTVELRKQLLEIKGVGPYAAASLLVLLGRYDYVGVDSWAKKLVSRQFYAGQPVGDKEIQETFERFGRCRALAYWFYRYDDV
jgi:3-methyladenine DNA glycosylase/8-oxoguanine DNA glycosylase